MKTKSIYCANFLFCNAPLLSYIADTIEFAIASAARS